MRRIKICGVKKVMKQVIGRILKKSAIIALSALMAISLSLSCGVKSNTALAKDDPYKQLAKGTTVYNGVDYKNQYNPLFYYLNYQDLREAFGADPNKLIEHYVIFGIREKRVANRLIGDSVDNIVPTGKEDMVVIPKTTHDNGGMTYEQEIQARSIAKQIADSINRRAAEIDAQKQAEADEKEKGKNNGKSSSSSKKKKEVEKIKDIEKVAYASGIVQAYCALGTYTTEGQMYRTAYGVFIGREYSCAGATRALGLILDYMGITWYHKNINQWADQWCQVIVDGEEGFADPTYPLAGYGKHPSEGGDAKKGYSYAKVREKFGVFTPILR